jgi:galactokinase
LAAQRAENRIAGAPTGMMDQMVCMRARAGHALFLDCRSLDARHVPFDPGSKGLTLLVVDTRTHHTLVGGLYGTRRRACQEAARVMGVPSLRDATTESVESARSRLGEELFRRATHVVTENARVLATVAILDAGRDPDAIALLLSASHASLRDGYEVSCPELDAVCDSAEAAGALGARLTGGGFGGSAIALVPTGLVDAVVSAVTAAAGDRHFPAPAMFAATPAGGAGQVG